MASPSDMVGPSPVTSNGTETTEIEDEISEEAEENSSQASSAMESVETQSAVGFIDDDANESNTAYS